MAELQTASKPGARRRPPLPRVDLTPMVDLGFLLIAFFMFTTTMARPHIMTLNMPVIDDVDTDWPAHRSVVLIPTSGHRIACYEGMYAGPQSLFWRGLKGSNSIRDFLLAKEKSLRAAAGQPAGPHPLYVLIKPAADCSYEDVVALLDEMHILGVQGYSLADLNETERSDVKNLR